MRSSGAVSEKARPISFTVGALRGRRRRSAIQAVIFTRQHWNRAAAVAWLKRNGFKASPLATFRGGLRASQHSAGRFARLRTIHTSGHPRPLKNPIGSGAWEEELTRDPREQGFMDAKAGKVSAPHPWYTPTERGHYAEGYIAGGQGRRGRPTPPARLKKNPRPAPPRKLVVLQREYRQAIELYQKFREARPQRIATMRVQMPRMLVRIGPVPWLYYLTTHKGGKEILYKHTFAKHARPFLASSHNGRALYLLGGEYDFTRDGIVDRPR